ncbi:MAG: insulinase family protein [Acidobacteriota bacterium]|jgi:zinc protease|nr:insulinase family protein [Acidobacteriota bacterium]
MRKILLIIILSAFGLTAFAQVRITPLNIKERTLDNGLKVISVQDKSNPVVTVQVWYKVGGKDDPQGKSGFAHMFEHMMFKSTKNMPNEKMDRITEDVGGFNNASTRDDLTNYYEVVPSNYLETLLWAESDRMVNLSVDAENFKSERDVVKEEYRQGVLANPYGMLFQYIDSLSYKVHPYKRGVIGNLDELNAAKLEDAFAFYKEYYRPDNASLIVVGDFEQEQLDKWIDKYFGRRKNPDAQIKRVDVVEPERTQVERFEKFRPNVPLPALAMTYFAPPSTSLDIPALEIAEAILADGQSSRLYQELVYKQQLAQTATMFADIRIDKGLLAFYAIAAGGEKLEDIEKAILAEINKLQENAPTEKEVEKAKNKLITEILQERETVNGKAFAIGEAIIYKNNPRAVNEDVAKLQSVTAQDVQNVMKKYFKENSRAVIYYKNETAGGKE